MTTPENPNPDNPFDAEREPTAEELREADALQRLLAGDSAVDVDAEAVDAGAQAAANLLHAARDGADGISFDPSDAALTRSLDAAMGAFPHGAADPGDASAAARPSARTGDLEDSAVVIDIRRRKRARWAAVGAGLAIAATAMLVVLPGSRSDDRATGAAEAPQYTEMAKSASKAKTAGTDRPASAAGATAGSAAPARAPKVVTAERAPAERAAPIPSAALVSTQLKAIDTGSLVELRQQMRSYRDKALSDWTATYRTLSRGPAAPSQEPRTRQVATR